MDEDTEKTRDRTAMQNSSTESKDTKSIQTHTKTPLNHHQFNSVVKRRRTGVLCRNIQEREGYKSINTS